MRGPAAEAVRGSGHPLPALSLQQYLEWLSSVPGFVLSREQHRPTAAKKGSKVVAGSSRPGSQHGNSSLCTSLSFLLFPWGQSHRHQCQGEAEGNQHAAHHPTACGPDTYVCDPQEGTGPACRAALGHPVHRHHVRDNRPRLRWPELL